MSTNGLDSNVVAEARRKLAQWQQARPIDYFAADNFFQGVLERHLPGCDEGFADRLHEIGSAVAGPMELLAAECGKDHRLPRVERVDSIGNRIEQVIFDPAYHQLGELFWASGVLAELGSPGRRGGRPAPSPTCSTTTARPATPARWRALPAPSSSCSGSAPTSRSSGTSPPLLDTDYAEPLRAAQFVTEVQGGSDVGANACVAEPDSRIGRAGTGSAARSGSARWPTPASSWSRRGCPEAAAGHPRASASSWCRARVDGEPNGFTAPPPQGQARHPRHGHRRDRLRRRARRAHRAARATASATWWRSCSTPRGCTTRCRPAG